MIRHRVVTLGPPGPTWPRAVARWGSSATLPLDATTCVTAEELRALVTSTPVSVAIVDPGLPGVDRLLADEVRRAGVALAAVDGPALARAARRLDPDVVLPDGFGPESLSAVLQARERARPVPRHAEPPTVEAVAPGRLVVVTGPGGSGVSTVAQALATDLGRRSRTVLADLAPDGDQHLRHGVPPGHDGVFELAELLRHSPAHALTAPTLTVPGGYQLLCGLRRRQEWTALTGSVADQVLDVLRRGVDHVVADVAADLDGRAETGSLDLEERNGLARAAVSRADLVVVVGRATTTGIHRLVRTALEVARHTRGRDHVCLLLNGTPRAAARQAALRRATAALLADAGDGPWPRPGCLAHDRRVEARLREGSPLPSRLTTRTGRLLAGPP